MPCDGTISIPEDCDFPLQNLPYGVFRLIGSSLVAALDHEDAHHGSTSRIGVALGNRVVDMSALHRMGVFADAPLIRSSECFLKARVQLDRALKLSAACIVFRNVGTTLHTNHSGQ